jgi:hypothetical protein
MAGKNKCIICGKKTDNESFCSKWCVDEYEGENPRGSSPGRHDDSFDWARYDPDGGGARSSR